MMPRVLTLAVMLGVAASVAAAQSSEEPPLLQLPAGARVRVRMTESGSWIKGVLVSADATSIRIVPDGAPPFVDSQLRLPSASITRFELVTGRRSKWIHGLVAGAVVGLAMAATAEVDPVACQSDYNYECSRGGAYATYGITSALLGAAIGAAIKGDRWTPVGLDALAPPPARRGAAKTGISVLPGGGVGFNLAVGF